MILFSFIKFIVFLHTYIYVYIESWYIIYILLGVAISYIFLHKNYFKTYLPKTISTCYLTVSDGQEFRNNVARSFWVRVLYGVAVMVWARSWRVYFQDVSLTWLESWSWLLIEASVSHYVDLSVGLLESSWNVVLASLEEATRENKAGMATSFMT